jgi:hypothetical protein
LVALQSSTFTIKLLSLSPFRGRLLIGITWC